MPDSLMGKYETVLTGADLDRFVSLWGFKRRIAPEIESDATFRARVIAVMMERRPVRLTHESEEDYTARVNEWWALRQ